MAASALAWTAGAAASVAVGLIALTSINAGSADGESQQVAPDGLIVDVTTPATSDAPAAGPAPSSAPASTRRSTPSPTANSTQRLYSSTGGTVVARCSGGNAYLVSWSPAQGYEVGRVRRGPAPTATVGFRSA